MNLTVTVLSLVEDGAAGGVAAITVAVGTAVGAGSLTSVTRGHGGHGSDGVAVGIGVSTVVTVGTRDGASSNGGGDDLAVLVSRGAVDGGDLGLEAVLVG